MSSKHLLLLILSLVFLAAPAAADSAKPIDVLGNRKHHNPRLLLHQWPHALGPEAGLFKGPSPPKHGKPSPPPPKYRPPYGPKPAPPPPMYMQPSGPQPSPPPPECMPPCGPDVPAPTPGHPSLLLHQWPHALGPEAGLFKGLNPRYRHPRPPHGKPSPPSPKYAPPYGPVVPAPTPGLPY